MQQCLCKKCKKMPIYLAHSSNYCKRCYETRRDATSRYAKAHRKEAKERTVKWQKAHPERMKEYRETAKKSPQRALSKKLYNQEYKKSHKGKLNRRQSYQRNLDKVLEYSKEYYLKNRKFLDEYRKNWKKNNQDKSRQYSKSYRDRHPEIVTLSTKKRRERLNSIQGTFTLAEWNSLCDSYGNRCLKCGRGDVKLTIDHIIPISKNGSNSIDNIQPLCQSCNSSKGTKIIDYRNGAKYAAV